MARKRTDHPCLACGKIIRGASLQQRYCLDCRIRRRREAERRQREAAARQHAPDIPQVVRLAAAEHLSYGQYVARHRL